MSVSFPQYSNMLDSIFKIIDGNHKLAKMIIITENKPEKKISKILYYTVPEIWEAVLAVKKYSKRNMNFDNFWKWINDDIKLKAS